MSKISVKYRLRANACWFYLCEFEGATKLTTERSLSGMVESSKIGTFDVKLDSHGQISRVDETVLEQVFLLYRAVGLDEYYELIETQKFTASPSGLGVKYFGVNLEETRRFADKAFNLDVVAVFEVAVLSDVLERIGDFTSVDRFIFKHGTVEIPNAYLDLFNVAIRGVVHKY